MKKKVVNLMNKEVSEVELPESVFGIKTFPDILHQYIRYQNAKNRQGTHKTKTRSEVNGRAKKPFSQKELATQDKEVLSLLILEVVQLQWVHKIEIIHFHLIKKKKY